MTKNADSASVRPVAECLLCGHMMTLAVWQEVGISPGRKGNDGGWADITRSIGVCKPCAARADELRGPCSDERGCFCKRYGEVLEAKRGMFRVEPLTKIRLAYSNGELQVLDPEPPEGEIPCARCGHSERFHEAPAIQMPQGRVVSCSCGCPAFLKPREGFVA